MPFPPLILQPGALACCRGFSRRYHHPCACPQLEILVRNRTAFKFGNSAPVAQDIFFLGSRTGPFFAQGNDGVTPPDDSSMTLDSCEIAFIAYGVIPGTRYKIRVPQRVATPADPSYFAVWPPVDPDPDADSFADLDPILAEFTATRRVEVIGGTWDGVYDGELPDISIPNIGDHVVPEIPVTARDGIVGIFDYSLEQPLYIQPAAN